MPNSSNFPLTKVSGFTVHFNSASTMSISNYISTLQIQQLSLQLGQNIRLVNIVVPLYPRSCLHAHKLIVGNTFYSAIISCYSRELIMKYGVRVRVLGDLSLLPKEVLEQIARAVMMSQDNKNALLNVCFAYSSQHEMTEAIKRMATGVEEGLLLPRYVLVTCNSRHLCMP